MDVTELVDSAITAALFAGQKINEVYTTSDFNIQMKEDHTPVTVADQLAHNEILERLKCTELPVLSEEGIHLDYSERKNWELFWLVDPLDGTKEFIKRNDEFTVNIALIEGNKSIAGVIYAPITGEFYVGIQGIGSFKLFHPKEDCTFQFLQLSGTRLPEKKATNEFVVAISRSHVNRDTEAYIEALRKEHSTVKIVSKGSSLKICMVAEGTANIYPKFGTTMEWDTAAGHAIVRAAGKNILYPDSNTELTYNKKDLRNSNFIVQ